jgi:hypothetical protein
VTKPPDPHDLVLRVDRAVLRAEQIHRSATTAERDALRGELSQVGIQSILGFLEMERRTGILRIVGTETARLEIREGQIIRAYLESLSKATPRGQLFRILDFTKGRFEFVQQDVTGPDEIQLPTTNVLIEHARIRDEQGR